MMQSPEERTLQKFVESHPDKRSEVLRFMKDSLSPLIDKFVLLLQSFSVVYLLNWLNICHIFLHLHGSISKVLHRVPELVTPLASTTLNSV